MIAAGSAIENLVADAAGPEVFTFEELFRLLASSAGARVRLVRSPPSLGFALTRLVGLLRLDMMVTREGVDGVMAGLLTSDAEPIGTTRLGDCLNGHAYALGRGNVSELRCNPHGYSP